MSNATFESLTIGQKCSVCVERGVENPGIVDIKYFNISGYEVSCSLYPNHWRVARATEIEAFEVSQKEREKG